MSDAATTDAQKTNDSARVTIYSTTWCAFCKTEKQWLDKLGVAYIEKNVEVDADAHNELVEKNGGPYSGVPITDVDGDLVLGFDRPKIDQLMKEKGILQAA
jgi:glutaredoxin